MHIEIISNNKFFMFINANYVDSFERDSLTLKVKNVIMKYRLKLGLEGFYKVKVFVNEKVGLFVDIYKLDDLDYSNSLDLRVLIFFDECVYFETDDYFLLDGISNVRYYDSKYYCLADSIDIYKLVEFGRFIYGDEVNKMLEDSFCV